MSSTSASFSLQVEKTTLPTILKVFFLVRRIKHYRVCLPLFRHRRNTTILLLSITKPQKADKERETILQKLADKVSHCKNLWTTYQLFSLPKSMASASVQPATIVQKGKSKEHSWRGRHGISLLKHHFPQSQNKVKPFALSIEKRERSKVERRHLSSHTDWFDLQFQSYRRQSSHKRTDTLHLRDQHHRP